MGQRGNKRATHGAKPVGFFAALTLLLTGCFPAGSEESTTPTSPPPPAPSPAPVEEVVEADPPATTLLQVIDGDTVVTSEGTVRIIGIDTPEVGECGYDEAIWAIDELLTIGDTVELELPPGQNDTDVYDRLLRYVTTEQGFDVGFTLVEAGLAVARYDSADGYPEHPREAQYHDAQSAALVDGKVITVECKAAAERAAEAERAELIRQEEARQEREAAHAWYTKYSSCSKLKKNTVGDPKGPFDRNNPAELDIYNYFQFETGFSGDGDNDGLACE